MKTLVVVNGYPQSGKDTFIDFCLDTLPNSVKHSTVDTIKKVAKLLGWDGVKDEKGRKFLSNLKYLSINFNDWPFEEVIELIKLGGYDYIFTLVREPLEIEKLYKFCKDNNIEFIHIFITRPKSCIFDNEADRLITLLPYSIVINNTSTLEDLKQKALTFTSGL